MFLVFWLLFLFHLRILDGIPKVYCYGANKTVNIIVMELLGKSLEAIFNRQAKKMNLKSVCVIGYEMVFFY